MKLAFLTPLLKDGAQSVSRGVAINNEGFLETWLSENWSGANSICYAQALGVVVVGSLLVELSWRVRVRNGRPSCRASQGQNYGVRRSYGGSGEVRQSA